MVESRRHVNGRDEKPEGGKMVCINDLDEQERERGGRKLEEEGREGEIEKAEFVPRVYEASIPRRHAPRLFHL